MNATINMTESFESICADLDTRYDRPLYDDSDGFRLWFVGRNATHEFLIGFDREGTFIAVTDSEYGRTVRKL